MNNLKLINNLKAALLFAGKNDVRRYLNGVYIEATNEALKIIATNGHGIFISQLDNNKDDIVINDGNYLLCRDSLESALKVVKKLDCASSNIGKQIVLSGNGFNLEITNIDGATFPNWRRIMPLDPHAESNPISAVNGYYLEDVAKASKLLGRKGNSPVLSVTRYGGAIYRVARNAIILLMGMKVASDDIGFHCYEELVK